MSPQPPRSAPSRRTLFRGTAGLGLVLAAGPTVTACSTGPSERQQSAQALVPLLVSAQNQQRQAQQLAPTETDYTRALGQVATERGEHAQALLDEINRLNASTASDVPSATTVRPLDLDGLRAALSSAATQAAVTAAEASGFQAGLLASISASCTT
ncbi:MAG: hypothetical protein WAW85_05265, partial [Gordonia sp. (in: high G+C Gram-positive bacteria)]